MKDAVAKPDNIDVLSELLLAANETFPDTFAISISDNEGNIILDDFDGHIGDVCRADLKQHVETGVNNTKVHPNPFNYHYDVISEWQNKSTDYLLFMSFKLDQITNIIHSIQPHGQKLFLTIKKDGYLIEVTAMGERIKLKDRLDYMLTNDQINNIICEHNVPDTQWTMVAIQSPEEKDNYYIKILSIGLAIYITCLVIIYIILGRSTN